MSVALCSMKPHNGTDYLQFYETSQYVTGLILYPIICIYGLVGNCLILAVLSRKSMQSSTNIYLSALAVSDTLKLVNDLLYSLTVLLTHLARPHGQRMFRLLYPNSHFISNMSASVSSWLTVSVAVERFLLVCHPTRSVTLVTRSRAICIAVACYVLMTAVAVPSAFRYQVNLNDTDNGSGISLTRFWCENQQFVKFYTMLQNMLRSSVPLVILVFMNAFIINALRKTRANKKMASRNRITVLLCIVIIVFLICVTPDALMSGVFGLGYVDANNLVRGVREFTDLLLVVNSAVNFTLYAAFNKAFREQLYSLFAGVETAARRARIGGGRNSSVGGGVAGSCGVGGANSRGLTTGYRQITKGGVTSNRKQTNGRGSMRFAADTRGSRDLGSESSSTAITVGNAGVKETRDL